MNWSTAVHAAIGLTIFGLIFLLGDIWGAALGGSLFFYAREMRDHQRERQTAGRGHRNKFQAWDLLPGVHPAKPDTLFDWAAPAAVCLVAALALEVFYRV